MNFSSSNFFVYFFVFIWPFFFIWSYFFVFFHIFLYLSIIIFSLVWNNFFYFFLYGGFYISFCKNFFSWLGVLFLFSFFFLLNFSLNKEAGKFTLLAGFTFSLKGTFFYVFIFLILYYKGFSLFLFKNPFFWIGVFILIFSLYIWDFSIKEGTGKYTFLRTLSWSLKWTLIYVSIFLLLWFGGFKFSKFFAIIFDFFK